MRSFSVLVLAGMVLAATGCHHVGGKCDCGPQPGDALTYAPSNSVLATRPASLPSSGGTSVTPNTLPMGPLPSVSMGTKSVIKPSGFREMPRE